MRFEELHLERFGHFEDLRLDLSGENILLHLIYGPNEAGKSTALAAICDVLFGIPERTPYYFLHGRDRLRIGATIKNAAGRELSFKRRKARGNGLLKQDESGELPADSLVPYLSIMSEESFRRMFGLNHQRLREGGKAMLEADGDIARSLFEAGGGTAGLARVIRQLSDEADAIGAPSRKASTKPYWLAHERYDHAVLRTKSETLRADDWLTADRATTEAQAELKLAVDALTELRRQLSAHERLRRVAPILRRIDDLEAERFRLGEGPDLPLDFADDWKQAARTLEEAAAEVARSEKAVEQLRTDLNGIGDAGPWPAFAERIAALVTELGDYRAKRRDVPHREKELEIGWARVSELLDKIELTIARDQISVRAPSARAIATARSLITEWNRLDVQLHAAREAVDDSNAAALRAERRLSEIGSPHDPSAAAAAAKSAADLGSNTTGRHLQARRALEQADENLRFALSGLDRWNLDAETLVKRPFPSIPTVAQSERTRDRLEEAEANLAKEREKLDAEIRRLIGEIAALQASGEIPTEDALNTARQNRDVGWRLVRRQYIENREVSDAAISEFAGEGELADAYETTVHHCDSLADSREHEADRIARFAACMGQLEKTRADIAAIEERQRNLADRMTAWKTDWIGLWRDSGIEAGSPSEMQDWLARRDELVAQELATRSARSAELVAAAEDREVREHLERSATELGLDIPTQIATPVLREKVAVALNSATEAWKNATDLKQLRREQRQESDDRSEQLREVEQRLVNWRGRWTTTASQLGLQPDSTVEEMEEALAVWQEIEKVRADLLQTEKRLREMRAVLSTYDAEVASLLKELHHLADDLLDESDPAALVAEFQRRLEASQRLEARIADTSERLRNAEGALETAQERANTAEENRGHLRQEYGLEDNSDVLQLAHSSNERRTLAMHREEQRALLRDAGDGLDEVELRAAAEGTEIDDIAAETSRLEGEIVRQQQCVQTAVQTVAEAEGTRRGLGQREGAGSAAQEANDAAAEMACYVERWLRLQASGFVLKRAVERYREQNQGPLVQRASEIFAAVAHTGVDPIVRLSADYTEAEKPILVGYRKSGKLCPITGMSDGTLDQLYLALRIAATERFMDSAEPMPFIADDLFTTSDEARTAAGVEALAALGVHTQVLLFTHHQYVVDIARAALGAESLRVHYLGTGHDAARSNTGASQHRS